MALFRGETTELETCLEYERIAHVWDARPPNSRPLNAFHSAHYPNMPTQFLYCSCPGTHGNVFDLGRPVEPEADVAAMTAPVEPLAFCGVAHFSVS